MTEERHARKKLNQPHFPDGSNKWERRNKEPFSNQAGFSIWDNPKRKKNVCLQSTSFTPPKFFFLDIQVSKIPADAYNPGKEKKIPVNNYLINTSSFALQYNNL